MRKLQQKIASLENYQSIGDYLPEDSSERWSLNRYLDHFYSSRSRSPRVLDLGCGEGSSMQLFRTLDPDTEWHGVDIESSPEVNNRRSQIESARSFDGVNLPYPDETFDLIYCHQVLEHVRHPDALVANAWQTLKPGGIFIGSVAYLEPYHSYSVFNFTPYAIVRVFTDAGFNLQEIRPGVDASMLINRQFVNRARMLRPLWNRNYLHGMISIAAALARLNCRESNFLKIQFSGQLVFLANRPE